MIIGKQDTDHGRGISIRKRAPQLLLPYTESVPPTAVDTPRSAACRKPFGGKRFAVSIDSHPVVKHVQAHPFIDLRQPQPDVLGTGVLDGLRKHSWATR